MTPRNHGFSTFNDVVDAAEHLEHFHSYTRPAAAANADEPTLDMHTDQGLFIAFTPAMSLVGGEKSAHDAADFFLKLADESVAKVAFDPATLVVMLGDGVRQFVNPKLQSGAPLRAAPHALVMKPTAADDARVWYGRMVLAPSDALHPGHVADHVASKTYGAVRRTLIEETRSGKERAEVLSVGCSGGTEHVSHNRELNTCAAGTLYCWNRCMNITEDRGVWFGVDEATCSAQGGGFAVKCINPQFQVYDPDVDRHGDYYPHCTDSNLPIADPPPLYEVMGIPEPATNSACSASAWTAFSSTTGYDMSFPLCGEISGGWGQPSRPAVGDECHGLMMWKITGGAASIKVVYKGAFGYLALGVRAPGQGVGTSAMYNGDIVMALGGGDYTPRYGMNYSYAGSMGEYKMHPTQTRYRHWMAAPYFYPTPTSTNHAFTKTDCFFEMTFDAAKIGNSNLNLNGADTLIWAAAVDNNLIEYHGREHRGIITMDWASGATIYDGYPPPPAPKPPTPDAPSPPTAPPTPPPPDVGGVVTGVVIVGLVLMVIVFALTFMCVGCKSTPEATKGKDVPVKSADIAMASADSGA